MALSFWRNMKNELLIPDNVPVPTEAEFIEKFNKVIEENRHRYTDFKTVKALEINNYGFTGTPLYFFQQEVTETFEKSVPPSNDNRYSSHSYYQSKEKVLVTFVVVGVDYESAISKLHNNYVHKCQELNNERDNNREVIRNYQELQKGFDLLKQDVDKKEEQRNNLFNSNTKHIEKVQLMESDLAKIKSAIGELKFNEIVGVK